MTHVSAPPTRRRTLDVARSLLARPNSAAAVLVAVTVAACILNHFKGVEWGDDFALYMRQAKALVEGNVGQVIADNRFTVDNSGWHSFSPYVYPWGWPLLASTVIAVSGLAYGTIELLQVAAFAVFLLTFHALMRPRVGRAAALLLMVFVAVSSPYINATDTVRSDIPYLGAAGLALWWVDRCHRKGLVQGTSRRELVALGLLMAFAFNIRREGIALVVALAALHVVVLTTILRTPETPPLSYRERIRRIDWHAVALPYGVFALTVVGFQLLLPSVLFPRYDGRGLGQISHHLSYYRDAIAEQIGLKDPGRPLDLLGSAFVAERAVQFLVVAACVGLTVRLASRHREDVPIAAYVLALAYIVGTTPPVDGRYLFSMTPFLAYYAFQAVPTLARVLEPSRRWLAIAAVVPALGLGALVVANVGDLAHSTRFHLDYPDYVADGPEQPSARAMFDAVRDRTRPDDVILFNRARAMTLYTERRSIQGSDVTRLIRIADWYVMQKNSDYAQTLLTDAQAADLGLAKAWENDAWVLWRATRSP